MIVYIDKIFFQKALRQFQIQKTHIIRNTLHRKKTSECENFH